MGLGDFRLDSVQVSAPANGVDIHEAKRGSVGDALHLFEFPRFPASDALHLASVSRYQMRLDAAFRPIAGETANASAKLILSKVNRLPNHTHRSPALNAAMRALRIAINSGVARSPRRSGLKVN